jgi:17beta-estradiol 17-dehydrogenase / very-long-chain 3-oxoacyl-CoA reductase
LTSYFLRRCEETGKRGGIVNISSYSWVIAMPYVAVYAATKAFNDVFSRCTSKEANNMDIVSVRAMQVISGRVKKSKSMSVCTSR